MEESGYWDDAGYRFEKFPEGMPLAQAYQYRSKIPVSSPFSCEPAPEGVQVKLICT